MKFHFEITVMGKGEFPLDMLRYSQCCPVNVEDVANMERPRVGASGDEELAYLREPRTVRVNLHDNYAVAANCVARFASFGWSGRITMEDDVVVDVC